jgi:hypothetical protein
VHFLGTWENSGSFVNEAGGWWPDEKRVKEALFAFHCGKTAKMFDEAAELGMQIANRYDSDQDITPEQEAQRKKINRKAEEDVSYEKLAAFIREHQGKFLK